MVGFVIAGVAAVLALEQRNAAERERDIALSRQLAASSEQQLTVDPELAVLLARQAAHTARTAQAEDALRAALQSPIRGTVRGPRTNTSESHRRRGRPSGHRWRLWQGPGLGHPHRAASRGTARAGCRQRSRVQPRRRAACDGR